MAWFLRFAAWTLAVALAVLPVVGVLNGWFAAQRWPISKLSVQAQYQRVDEAAIRDAVAPLAAAGFFAVDLEAVRAAVAQLDWVASVEVRKRWPDALVLVVTEHQPFARWGEDHVVSAEGVVFTQPASGMPEHLPNFEGSRERLPDLVSTYNAVHPLFALHGGQLESIRLSGRGSWSFRLLDGTTVMAGRGEPVARLQRFLPLLAAVKRADGRVLERADLRYANGFALRWAETDPAAGEAATENGTGT